MPAFPTNSLIFFPCACWSEGCFFDHWRSDVTFPLIAGGTTRQAARKHRAPKGALRHERVTVLVRIPMGQKAPSAKRCIKTAKMPSTTQTIFARKHRAPKGALRPFQVRSRPETPLIRQKAPSAKRCIKTRKSRSAPRIGYQKAPSAKRCIKLLFRVGCG